MGFNSSEQAENTDLVNELSALEAAIISGNNETRDAHVAKYLATLRLVLRDCLANGQVEQADSIAHKAIMLLPDCEEVHEALIHLYMQSGRATKAIRHLEMRQNLPQLVDRSTSLLLTSKSETPSKRQFRGARRMLPLAVPVAAAALIMAVTVGQRFQANYFPPRAKAKSGSLTAPLSPKRALETALTAYNDRADYGEAERLCDIVLAQYRLTGNEAGIADVLARKGQAVEAQGDFASARRCFEEAITVRRQRNEQLAVAHLLELLSDLSQRDGDYKEADRMLQQSQSIREKAGDRVGVALCLRDRGILAADQCRFETAAANYGECIRIVAPLDKPEIEAHVHALQGMAARDQGDFRKARALFTRSLAFWQARNHPRWTAGMKRGLAITAFYEGKDAEAETLLAESLKGYGGVGDRASVAGTQIWLARVLIRQGRVDEASLLLKAATEAQQAQMSPLLLARTWEAQAEVLAQSNPGQAGSLLASANAQRERLNCPPPPVERSIHIALVKSLH